MADLTITELRDMTPTQRAAHAAAQEERWVLNHLPPTGTVKRDDLVARLRGWMGAAQIDLALQRLQAVGTVGGQPRPGGDIWMARDGDT